MPTLDAAQARVVGSLIEKQLTTPQQYPLTLNALVSACNQSSNRDPVVAYTEDQVAVVLDQLKEQRLVRFVLPSHGRSVVRYRHVVDEALGIDQPQLAVLAVLLLRGPQTVGELRIRTDRMASFDSLAQVQHELDLLAGLEEPLAVCQPRRPGQKEERWVELLSADQVAAAAGESPPPGTGAGAGAVGTAVEAGGQAGPSSSADVVAEVRQELARLAADVATLRTELQELRDSLGG